MGVAEEHGIKVKRVNERKALIRCLWCGPENKACEVGLFKCLRHVFETRGEADGALVTWCLGGSVGGVVAMPLPPWKSKGDGYNADEHLSGNKPSRPQPWKCQ